MKIIMLKVKVSGSYNKVEFTSAHKRQIMITVVFSSLHQLDMELHTTIYIYI